MIFFTTILAIPLCKYGLESADETYLKTFFYIIYFLYVLSRDSCPYNHCSFSRVFVKKIQT